MAFQVNKSGSGYIADARNKMGATLVYFSTDYVFDGSKNEYVDFETPDPINSCGRSKLLREQKIAEKFR